MMQSQSILPARILIVDDVPENLQVLRTRLRLRKFDVVEATGGQEALEQAMTHLPDLILLDVQMPEMDGFEVCRHLKAHEQTRAIPIIFITGRGDTDDLVNGFKAGAVDYVIKPFNSAELLTRVQTHLDLKFARDALKLKNAELEKLNKEKSEFLGIAAHDLKNPLASVRWLTDMLKTGLRSGSMTAEKSGETLDKISLSVERMFRLVKTLLDANAVEEASTDAPLEKVNLVFAVADVLAQYDEIAERKQIVVEFQNAAQNAMVLIHGEILQQIIDNLVSNALKYSPLGKSVVVHIWNEASKENPETPATVSFSIRDDGEGIGEEEQHKLFQKFTTLSAKPTANEDSSGLGLFIVKKLTEAAGGTISCESTKHHGATFTVRFPVVQREVVRFAEDIF
ncbi:MAG: hybrid sensor histidine kinase/response regulator [Candidatus Kapaibacterium sp.]|nr:MAG: hybrid sensor histidine kinase/response regulator [Candidatus Kapabacteria bacterium]